MNVKRVVMLDFDGVINRVDDIGYYLGSFGEPPIDRVLARRVGNLVNELDASVVVSSDWRRHYTLDELRQFLGDYGSIPSKRVIDTTEIGRIRGEEIANWLNDRDKPVRLAILDDNHLGRFNMDRVRPWFVKTKPETGVSEDNIKAARKLLTQGPIYAPRYRPELTNA